MSHDDPRRGAVTAHPTPELALRITVRRPPSGVAFAVQRGGAELLEPSARTRDALVFDFTVRVGAVAAGGAPRFLGPFTQGPPAARFVYVNSGRRAGQAASCWDRRAKVPLAGITASMLRAASASSTARIETELDGTGPDGGPTCAMVKATVWRVALA